MRDTIILRAIYSLQDELRKELFPFSPPLEISRIDIFEKEDMDGRIVYGGLRLATKDKYIFLHNDGSVMVEDKPSDGENIKLFLSDGVTATLIDIYNYWKNIYPEEVFVGESVFKVMKEIWDKEFPMPDLGDREAVQKRNWPFAPEIVGIRYLLGVLCNFCFYNK